MGRNWRVFLAAGAVVLIAAGAIGVGVYVLSGEEGGHAVITEPAAPEAVSPAGPAETQPVATADEQADAEYDAFMEWLEEEAAREAEAEAEVTEAAAEAAPVEEAPAEPMPDMSAIFAQAEASTTGANVPRWRAIWSDLNLTAEEQGRLRQGFGMLMARWATMPPEQQAAERARMQEMRVRWEGMDDDARAGASQRMRDRFEEWRASGRVELPELTLD